jgi:hypothetical protein
MNPFSPQFSIAYLALGLIVSTILLVIGIRRVIKLSKLEHEQFERAIYDHGKRLRNDAIITQLNRNADWRD